MAKDGSVMGTDGGVGNSFVLLFGFEVGFVLVLLMGGIMDGGDICGGDLLLFMISGSISIFVVQSK